MRLKLSVGVAAPVGQSAAQVVIGNPERAFVVDAAAKELIDYEPPAEILDTRPFTIKLTELDIKTGTGKAEVQGQEPDTRYQCSIVDPVVHDPQSPYSNAFNEQRWLAVSAKPHMRSGELHKLTVLDTVASS